jgi:hypoxia up-regulated 1
VTVPGWWNQYQRKAYRDALELQGLTCLSMIGEGTGVALNYAMTRQFPDYDPKTGRGQKEYHLIYDSGAMQTTATVVAFWQESYLPNPKSKTPINTTFVDVLSTGHEDIGGVNLDLIIRDLLLKDFVVKTKKSDVAQDKRALAKLDKEANRVKHILSANQESNVNVSTKGPRFEHRLMSGRIALRGH